jgi:hypothetical protein
MFSKNSSVNVNHLESYRSQAADLGLIAINPIAFKDYCREALFSDTIHHAASRAIYLADRIEYHCSIPENKHSETEGGHAVTRLSD